MPQASRAAKQQSDIAKLAKAIQELATAHDRLADIHERRLGEVAAALESCSNRMKWLGTGDASTPMGALEALGKSIEDSAEALADSINSAANRIAEAREQTSGS